MKLVAMMSFWDEKPAWLSTVVSSAAAAGCNHIVCVDGPYALLSLTRSSSGVEQHDAIIRAASVAGIGLTLHVPDSPFVGNEVEKRSLMFRLALEITSEDDWLLSVDADMPVSKALGLRRRLEHTDLNAAEVTLMDSGSRQSIRLLFRAMRGLEVADTHFNYRYPIGDSWSYLWGNRPLEPALQLHDITVEHWTDDRDPVRKAEQVKYYDRRDSLGIESSDVLFEGVDGKLVKLKGKQCQSGA